MDMSGSCLCNAVHFRLNSDPVAVVNCHCNLCRKQSGAAFSTYVVIPEKALEIISGGNSVSDYQVKENAHKFFCKHCGSPLYNKNERYPGLLMIYLGEISMPENIAPTANIYCDSQLSWVSGIAELRSFAHGIVKHS